MKRAQADSTSVTCLIRPPTDSTLAVGRAAAHDAASGVAGYRVYLGPAEDGTSDWYVQVPQIDTPELAAGTYYLRVQPIDYAGNVGTWTTLGTVDAE